MTKQQKDWKGVTGGNTFGQKAMKTMFSWVDVRIGYAILVFIIPFYMLFARKGYIAIYRYFRRQHNFPPLKSLWKTYQNHYLFGQMLMDRFSIYAGRNSHFEVDNPDNHLFLSMLHKPGGFIMASSHVGNPELCGYLLKQQIKPINSLIYGGEAEEVQKNRSKVLENNNVRLIPVTGDMSHIFLINEALSNGEIVNMPCDRTFGSDKHVQCDFLNGQADFPIGPFVLAIQFNVPVLAFFVIKLSAKHYRIHVSRVPAPDSNLSKRQQIGEMTKAYARELEKIITIYPEQWFNFYNFWK